MLEASLNSAQAAAAAHPGVQPLLIIAGAGTGKTTTLAHRVARLRVAGVAAERILLLTFTRRAAETLARRAERIVASTARDNPALAAGRLVWAGTFHAIANRILRRHGATLGLAPGFSVLDRGDSADLLDMVRQDLGLASRDRRFPRKDTCLAIYSHRVNTQAPLADTLREHYPWCESWRDELTALFRRYVEVKLEQQVLDYDDLLLYWHAAMQETAFARLLGEQFDHVLVDEYQDTNTLQADILLALKPHGTGLCVVGDDAQSIYSFRAANVDNILGFPARFTPPACILRLEENYRSAQPILDLANALMSEGARQFPKRLHSPRHSGRRPQYVSVLDEQGQADFVVHRVLAAREEGIELRRQAVLMRSSSDSDLLEVELVRRNIPYVKYGGLKFLEAAHVKDLLAVLKWVDNPKNHVAGFRVLQLLPGIGPGHADRCLKVFAASAFDWQVLADYIVPSAARHDWTCSVALWRELAAASGWAGQIEQVRAWYEPHLQRLYEAPAVRLADIEQLGRLSTQYHSREHFVTELTLDPPQVTGDRAGSPRLDEDYLILSTIHSAKGQEWESVYVLNVTDGSFPSEFAARRPAQLEEERRLLYVAITRARQDLHLTAPLRFHVTQQSRTGDRHLYGARSRFMTPGVLAQVDQVTWPSAPALPGDAALTAAPRVDVAARMRALWTA